LYGFIQGFGVFPETVGQQFDIEALCVNKQVKVYVEHTVKGDNKYANVTRIKPIRTRTQDLPNVVHQVLPTQQRNPVQQNVNQQPVVSTVKKPIPW
jgi:hypothetical protein